ncbi:coiled-coil domain-containing protein 126 [Conger conger]|uniref:coiled-coil domain-containing protein 126 n=1 Tax=Conger conger TaxID=82655 RepID=UPI002A59996C|nr:coiled-coil domain-containing protein 126 [Conger conger]
MLGALRRGLAQRLSLLLLLLGVLWGGLLLRYTLQTPGRQSSAQLRQQILELSQRYVRVLTEESREATGPRGPAMAGQADLKRTIAILLDDILQRLVKLEGKMDAVVNGSLVNATQPAGSAPAPAPPGQATPPRRHSDPRQPATATRGQGPAAGPR